MNSNEVHRLLLDYAAEMGSVSVVPKIFDYKNPYNIDFCESKLVSLFRERSEREHL